MHKPDWAKRVCGVFLLCAAPIVLPAQTFTTLHSFNNADGAFPVAALVQATDGNLYGTTDEGGASGACSLTAGCGTVFRITPSGTLTTLHSFDFTDGAFPGVLVQSSGGGFYGTTAAGGASNACSIGCGTVFKITPSGTLTTLHSFDSTDGANPQGLVQGTTGGFYGTTAAGGSSPACFGGCGTVFKITPTGMLTTLHSFDSTDGAFPVAGLVQATDGNLYGTTNSGGSGTACFSGCGTVFRITPSGTLTTLHIFDITDGEHPNAALVQATDGNLYGTTADGGANGNGTVFKITPGGTLTTLYSFCSLSGCTDGTQPSAALVQATDRNLYGTTLNSGANGRGTVFKITPSGTLTTLYSFCSQSGCTDGELPEAALLQDTNGSFYGTTNAGGTSGVCPSGCGTVYSVSVGLGPFVETQPTSGKVGKAVKILGTNLTGATSVTFNGTAAAFTVVSPSLITTTVPTGATSGKVKVTIPAGTLSSNLPFRVLP